jgi:hypothetical protein
MQVTAAATISAFLVALSLTLSFRTFRRQNAITNIKRKQSRINEMAKALIVYWYQIPIIAAMRRIAEDEARARATESCSSKS